MEHEVNVYCLQFHWCSAQPALNTSTLAVFVAEMLLSCVLTCTLKVMESLLSLSITDTPNNSPIHHDQLSPILTELEANTVPDTTQITTSI